jgi:hypothetical protein
MIAGPLLITAWHETWQVVEVLLVLISALALSLGSAWIRVGGGDADDAARSTARVGGKSQT